MNILVIDVGTSSMRGILYREDLVQLLLCRRKYCPKYGAEGELRQTAGEFENALTGIIQTVNTEAAGLGESVDAISVTAQRSSVLPLDREGNPLTGIIMWQDTRNRKLCGELEQYNDIIFRLSGAKVNTVFSGGKMAWIRREHPEIYDKTFKLVNIPEYLIHLMTGNYVTDDTYGSRSNLMNLREGKWDRRLLSIFGIDEDRLCELLPPGSICGTLTDSFAERTGCRRGLPVITAGGDQQCAAVGQGIFSEGEISVVTGTGAFLTASCDDAPSTLPSGMICNRSAVRGKYILEANVLACCSAFDWFCRNFYDDKEIDYAKINQELEETQNREETCMVLPYFQGRSTPEWNAGAAATIHNITLAATRADILRAILEGIFLEIKNNIDLFGSYASIEGAAISGGLTKSRIMNQLQADIYGLPLRRLEDSETTALGALMVTLYSLGKQSSYEEMLRTVCGTSGMEVIKPGEHAEYYLEKQRKMNLLYKKIYGTTEKEM